MALHGADTTAAHPRSDDPTSEASTIAIENGRIVTPSGTIEGGTVIVRDDRIDQIRTEPAPLTDRVIDASRRIVIPGIIDVHGDDFEHHLLPRSDATIDPRTAFSAADRMNVAHGITTKAHAIAFEDEDAEHRSPAGARALIDALSSITSVLGTNVIHARFELSAVDRSLATDVLSHDRVMLASLMHHCPGDGQYDDDAAFRRRYGTDVGLTSSHVEDILQNRTGTSDAWADNALEMIDATSECDVPIASHDDRDAGDVRRAAEAGIDISEFPLSKGAATTARAHGMTTVMGAPNLVRDESLFDNLRARDAIEMEVLDVLCADYHPPSLLRAPFVDTGEPLHQRVARVTEEPARMLGLADRGRLTPGARADITIVDPDPTPRPAAVLVGGRQVVGDLTDSWY